jgi:hypothetical protein
MSNLAPRPADNHPLNAADAERSKARVSDIELGLTHPIDGRYWRGKLELRIHALEEDASFYGLVPHEEAELRQLIALRQKARAA